MRRLTMTDLPIAISNYSCGDDLSKSNSKATFSPRNRKSQLFATLSAFAVSACGGGGSSNSGTTQTEADVSSDPTLTTPIVPELPNDVPSPVDETITDTTDEDLPEPPDLPSVEHFLSIKQTAGFIASDRELGESNAVVDLDLDGKDEVYIFPASMRWHTHPVENYVLIHEYDDNGVLNADYNIIWSIDIPENDFVFDNGEYVRAFPQNQLLNLKSGNLITSWNQDSEVVDFNGDGNADLFISGHGMEYGVGYEGNANNHLDDPEFWASYPGDYMKIILAGDEPTEVLVSEHRLFWHSARTGDLDGDGDIDIAAVNLGNSLNQAEETLNWDLVLFANDGDAKFEIIDGPADQVLRWDGVDYGYRPAVVEVGDLDFDGRADLLLGTQMPYFFRDSASAQDGIAIYDWNGTEFTLEKQIDLPTTFSAYGDEITFDPEYSSLDKLTLGDYDNDGDLDILAKITWYGNGIAEENIEGNRSGDVAFGMVIFKNNGNYNFETVQFETTGTDHDTNGGEFVDLNDDGLLDVVLSGQIYNTGGGYDVQKISNAIYINNGNDQFTRLSDYDDVVWELNESRVPGQVVGENYQITSWGVTNEENPQLFFVGQDQLFYQDNPMPNAIISFAEFDFA